MLSDVLAPDDLGSIDRERLERVLARGREILDELWAKGWLDGLEGVYADSAQRLLRAGRE